MKTISILMALIVALSISASATIMPDWIEELGPGDSYQEGEYAVTKGIAESAFTPQSFGSYLSFGDYGQTGGAYIEQDAYSNPIEGVQLGSVDRQLFGQSGSAYVAQSANGEYWDPENPQTLVTDVIGISKDQYAAFSGAIVNTEPGMELVQGTDMNGDGVADDWYGGGDNLQWYEAVQPVDPAWSADFCDYAGAYSTDVGVYESGYGSASVSADVGTVSLTPEDVYQINDYWCSGDGEVWQYGYPYQQKLADETSNPNLADFVSLDTSNYDGSAQLTETKGWMSSDVTLVKSLVQGTSGVTPLVTLAGSSSDGAEFENAIVSPDVDVITSSGSTHAFDWYGW
jgi:hypothetical protein